MKKSNNDKKIRSDLDLNLPPGHELSKMTDWKHLPHDIDSMIRLSEVYLDRIVAREDFEEERLRDKCVKPFVLRD